MNNQQIKIGVLVLLVVGLGVVFYIQFFRSPAPPPPARPKATSTTRSSTAHVAKKPGNKKAGVTKASGDEIELDALIASVRDVDFNYALSRGDYRDPMKPLVRTFASVRSGKSGAVSDVSLDYRARNMRVSGIVYNRWNPKAIMHNPFAQDPENEVVIVGRGYVFPLGILVEDITPTSVLLRVKEDSVPIAIHLEEQ